MSNVVPPLDWVTLSATIGAITGVVSLFTLVYLLGHKLGTIEKALNLSVRPDEFGAVSAKVDMLWKLYQEDRTNRIVNEIKSLLNAFAEKLGNPHKITQDMMQPLMRALFDRLGIKLLEFGMYKLVGGEATPVHNLAELSPNVTLVIEGAIERESRRASFMSRYIIDENMRLILQATHVKESDVLPAERGNKALEEKLLTFWRGYIRVVSDVIPSLLELMAKFDAS